MSDLARTDISGTDFREIDLSGKSVAHSTLTGCRFGVCRGTNFGCAHGSGVDFRGSDITGATFEKADESILACLIGAHWRGQEITHVSGWIAQSFYWCFATSAFVQIGCMTRSLQEWEEIGRDLDSLKILHDEQPKIALPETLTWWKANRASIVNVVESFGA
jgi:hypothetical protein